MSEAFTLGMEKSYDMMLAGEGVTGVVTKLGANSEYEGGWVWPTAEAAEAFRTSSEFDNWFRGRAEKFAVYRIELPLGWQEDVSEDPHPKDGVHRLLTSSLITGKVSG